MLSNRTSKGLLFVLLPVLVLCTVAQARAASWPLKRTIDLSSGFGDFRENRFHAGLDLRTGGKIGSRVYSPVDGYVWRINMSYKGYGKGLYLRDRQGRIYVFGHLSQFSNKIAGVVLAEQYAARRYYVDLYFPKDSIPVTKGEFIALTGQTGAGAPHLHFEVRSSNNRPMNPLRNGWKIKDKTRPTFARIGFKLVDDSSLFDDGSRKVYFNVRPTHTRGEYVLDTVPFINAPFGILADVYDQMRRGGMRQAVYKLTLTINGNELYQSEMDSLDFSQGPSVNLEYDFVEAAEGNTRTRRLFDRPGNIYPGSKATGNHGGVFGEGEYPSVGMYDGVITAEDAFGNTSTLKFKFFWGPPDDFYTMGGFRQGENQTRVAYLKPRFPDLALGADTVYLEEIGLEHQGFRSVQGEETVTQAADGSLEINYIPGALPALRIAKKFANGETRYESVVEGKGARLNATLDREHYPTVNPLTHDISDDGLRVVRRWDGVLAGPCLLSLHDGDSVVTRISEPQRWQSKRFVFYVAPNAAADSIGRITTSGPLNDTVDVSIYKVGAKQTEVHTFDDQFTVATSQDNFYEPRLIEIKEPGKGLSFNPTPVSKVYQILPEAFVTKQPFDVSLRVDAKTANRDKIGLCWWDEKDKQWVWVNDDTVTVGIAKGESQGGGYFAAVQDLKRPSIRNLNIKDGMTVNSVWPEVRCDLVDSLSGIADDRSIDVRINGDWLIPEYDPEREVLVARPYNPVTPGKCKLTISVVDRVGNKTELDRTFHVVQ